MMIVIDYGGRAPQDGAPFGGAVQAWDLDAEIHHDYASGEDVTRPLTADERVRFAVQLAEIAEVKLRAAIAAGIADIEAARQVAALDADEATTRAGQAAALATTAGTRATAVAGWTPQTATTVTTIAALQSRTLADLQAVRAEVAALHDRDKLILTAVQELYAARALLARGVDLAYRSLVGLARIVAGRL